MAYNNQQKNEPIIKANTVKKDNYADKAEEVIKKQKNKQSITTTQLRPILTKINGIIEKSKSNKNDLDTEALSQLQYLKMTIAYAAGREKKTKFFIEDADILEFINIISNSRKKEDLELFGKYFESLVAYHRYYGGNDQ